MSEPDTISSLTLDLLAWIAAGVRSERELMEGWRSTCPRLTIWEDAVRDGLVIRRRDDRGRALVEVTERGRALLARRRPACAAIPR